MRITRTQLFMLTISIFLLGICFFILPKNKTSPSHNFNNSNTLTLDTTFLFQKKVIPNRLSRFIFFLNQNCIPIQNEYELLLLLANPITRQKISHKLQIANDLLLLHAELADLKQLELSDLDAQILHFSQRNYQNPFTSVTMNLQVLANADAERISEDVGGWLAGNENVLIQNYELSLEGIEDWIKVANNLEFYYFAEFL